MLRRFATTSAQDMEAWAAPICATIQRAHCGRFDGAALRALYGEDAVFDDPCGTIPRPGIVGLRGDPWLDGAKHEPWTYHPPLFRGQALSEDAVGGAGDGDVVPAQARCRQVATYAFRRAPLSFALESTIVLTFADDRRIAVHEDRWWGRATTLNAAHGLVKRAGRVRRGLRRPNDSEIISMGFFARSFAYSWFAISAPIFEALVQYLTLPTM
ncbi:hypothetical protein JL721_4035 [Aureococcus anophagefferens]|nr:hypothetical protein JL721_4035 [Aureococcus anophagefferens]